MKILLIDSIPFSFSLLMSRLYQRINQQAVDMNEFLGNKYQSTAPLLYLVH